MEDHNRHKVYWDDYSGRFYFDTKVESLDRLSRQKSRHAEIMNRSSSKLLETDAKLIQSARDIVENKITREMDEKRASLKDMVSYRLVLKKLGKRNAANPWHDENLGHYGVGASYFEVTDQRETSKIEMDPAWKRRMRSKELLLQRKPMEIMNRNLDTDNLFLSWQQRSHTFSPVSDKKKKNKTNAGLKLPPITATKLIKNAPQPGDAVFLTQTGYYE